MSVAYITCSTKIPAELTRGPRADQKRGGRGRGAQAPVPCPVSSAPTMQPLGGGMWEAGTARDTVKDVMGSS